MDFSGVRKIAGEGRIGSAGEWTDRVQEREREKEKIIDTKY